VALPDCLILVANSNAVAGTLSNRSKIAVITFFGELPLLVMSFPVIDP
jgi:hypothetical protein